MKMHPLLPFNRAAGRIVLLAAILLIGLSACAGVQAPAPAQAANNGIANTGATPSNVTAMPSAAAMNDNQVTGTPAAKGTAPSAGPKAYIGLFKDNAVAVLDTAANKVIKTIPIAKGPHGLVITKDGEEVFASSDGDSKVSVIDTKTDTVKKTIEVGKAPHGLALTPDGRLLLAAVFGENQVVFIDTSSYQVVGQVAVPSPHNIAVSPDGHTAYVAAQKEGSTGLSVISIDKKAQNTFLPTAKAPRALNFSPDGKQLYFTEAGVNAVQVLDPASNQVTAQIDVGASPHHPLFTQDGSMALVVSQGPGEVYFLVPQTNVAFLSLKVGRMPHWIAINPQGTTAWVTNEADNTVSVIDLNKFSVVATISVGSGPRKIVVQPGQVADTATPAANTVTISGMAFGPSTLTVKAGQAITIINQDGVDHTITADQGAWDSGTVAPGQSYRLTLTKPGAYSYHCTIHPFMTGKIIVTQ